MDLRASVRKHVATRVSPTILGLILALGGAGLLLFGWGRYQWLAVVGVLYGLVGIATVLVERRDPRRFDIRSLWYLVVTILALLFVSVIAGLIWRRASYEPIAPDLVVSSLKVGIERFLKTVPVGFFVLVGYSADSSERIYVTPPMVVVLSFVTLMELLAGYQGFGWPLLPVLMIVAWLALVLVAGLPLYVLGITWRAAEVSQA